MSVRWGKVEGLRLKVEGLRFKVGCEIRESIFEIRGDPTPARPRGGMQDLFPRVPFGSAPQAHELPSGVLPKPTGLLREGDAVREDALPWKSTRVFDGQGTAW